MAWRIGASVGEKPTWMTHEPPPPTGLPAQPLFRMLNWPVGVPVMVAAVTLSVPPPVLVTVNDRTAGAAPTATVPNSAGATAVLVGVTDRVGVPGVTPEAGTITGAVQTPLASTASQKRSSSMFQSVSTPSSPPWWSTVTLPSPLFVIRYSDSEPENRAVSTSVAGASSRSSRTMTSWPGLTWRAKTACWRVIGLPTWNVCSMRSVVPISAPVALPLASTPARTLIRTFT